MIQYSPVMNRFTFKCWAGTENTEETANPYLSAEIFERSVNLGSNAKGFGSYCTGTGMVPKWKTSNKMRKVHITPWKKTLYFNPGIEK